MKPVLPSLLLLLLLLRPQPLTASYNCIGQANLWRSAIYARPENREFHLKDNECLSDVVLGEWCEWEPVEAAHGIAGCQRGLNIRWRRRLCNCPPPKPLHSSQTWCKSAFNASSVARLQSKTITRLEALKPAVWTNAEMWKLQQPFNRPGSLTNSLLSCIQLDECFFHTGSMYLGTVSRDRNGLFCLPWENFKQTLINFGLSDMQVANFIRTKPNSYCRNPLANIDHNNYFNSRLKPWCFVRNSEVGINRMWNYCDIPRCGSVHFHGTVLFERAKVANFLFRAMMKSVTKTPYNAVDSDPAGDLNAESCFETCRFRCEKYALMNVRMSKMNRQMRACQCMNESHIQNPELEFKKIQLDNAPTVITWQTYEAYNKFFGLDTAWGAFRYLTWMPCLLYNSFFRCPLYSQDDSRELFAAIFEISLPKNCYETNRMMYWTDLNTMTLLGAMGNFRPVSTIDTVTRNVLMSSRNPHSPFLNTLCTHRTASFSYCPVLSASSLTDANSYFNNVVDEDFQWIIIDIGSHRHITLLKVFTRGMDLSHMKDVELFVRGAPLPNWLLSTNFRSSDGSTGLRVEYFRKASMTEKALWWRCEEFKFLFGLPFVFAECSPHQRTRWVMLRMKVRSDLLQMKYAMGFDWLNFLEISRLSLLRVEVFEMPLDKMNCLTMHHPPMGPDHADYWEDLYSFDGNGLPLDPPVFAQSHPQFTLPLTTHDSIHPDERFQQEDWDVEACGDWQIMEDTTILGVPTKLKITITQSHLRGKFCYGWSETLGPIKECQRSVYFRVDNNTGEVIHYPEFGRSYGLTVNRGNCQFMCAIARECKAFEFSQDQFCQLHLISYSLDSMYAFKKDTVYGKKSDTMSRSNPFTWNNPYHPYYRVLQDLLEETGFFR